MDQPQVVFSRSQEVETRSLEHLGAFVLELNAQSKRHSVGALQWRQWNVKGSTRDTSRLQPQVVVGLE
jgi:hypothetical protein